jgi:hypothetical protein
MSVDLLLIHRSRDLLPSDLAAALMRLRVTLRAEAVSVEKSSYEVEILGVSVWVNVYEPITAESFGGEPLDEDDREALEEDPRKYAYVSIGSSSRNWPIMCAVGARLAVALDARPYDPQTGEWLELPIIRTAELRAYIERED